MQPFVECCHGTVCGSQLEAAVSPGDFLGISGDILVAEVGMGI